MKDKELYKQILGITFPWEVEHVELNLESGSVDVYLEHASKTRFKCPKCDVECPVYDHTEERVWRHLDSCQFHTFIHACPPRVKCNDDGIHQITLPFAEPNSRFTMLFERLAIDVLRHCDIDGARAILGISWDEAWHIKEKAVARGLKKRGTVVPELIGVDEKAVAKGHKYITVVSDVESSTVVDVIDDRKHESLDTFFEKLEKDQLDTVMAVSMDMWDPYILSVKTYLNNPEEKIVFDRYHIMKIIGTGVDGVRKQESRMLFKAGDKTLSGSKYLWLYSEENLPEKHKERFNTLKALNLKTSKAWAIKENLRLFWDQPTKTQGLEHFNRWYFWATHSRLEPIIKAAKTLKRHIDGMTTYFDFKITNAHAEGINSRIQAIKVKARGFRNQENFKTAILFHLGGLDLYPTTHRVVG
jgi:transposase